MADIPHSWGAYALFQHKLSITDCLAVADALEAALNVVLQPDFRPEAVTEHDLIRVAETAARRTRHRKQLLRRAAAADLDECSPTTVEPDAEIAPVGAPSLDDEVHARRELIRLKAMMRAPDWDLLTGVAAGVSYAELAAEQAVTAAALRARVCRLRRSIC